jgi:hypothetical protein
MDCVREEFSRVPKTFRSASTRLENLSLMTRTFRACRLLYPLVLLSAGMGCSGSSPMDSVSAPPPHGGSLLPLPGGKGYVEIVKKDAGSNSQDLTGEVAFYFLKDGTAPMSPAPTSGTLTVGKKVVTLKSDGDGLVTPIGPRILPKGSTLDGVLSFELGGKTLSVPLGIR